MKMKHYAYTLAEGRLACTTTQVPAISCPPLETLPNKNTPVDCFCERKPKSLISRWGRKRCAFTLAEVLITLAVIGIVAALTLPGLIQNHNETAWRTAKDLWEKKLTETVRRMNVDGVMPGHDTTEDFMNTFKN